MTKSLLMILGSGLVISYTQIESQPDALAFSQEHAIALMDDNLIAARTYYDDLIQIGECSERKIEVLSDIENLEKLITNSKKLIRKTEDLKLEVLEYCNESTVLGYHGDPNFILWRKSSKIDSLKPSILGIGSLKSPKSFCGITDATNLLVSKLICKQLGLAIESMTRHEIDSKELLWVNKQYNSRLSFDVEFDSWYQTTNIHKDDKTIIQSMLFTFNRLIRGTENLNKMNLRTSLICLTSIESVVINSYFTSVLHCRSKYFICN